YPKMGNFAGASLTSGREVSSRAMRRLFEQRAVLAGRRPPVGRRYIVDGGAELSCGVPAPAGVVEHVASQRDLVRMAAGEDLFSLLRSGDQADGNSIDLGRFLHRLREWNLITGSQGDFLHGRDAARRDGDPIRAAPLQFANEGYRLFHVPAALDPVGRGNLDANRLVSR